MAEVSTIRTGTLGKLGIKVRDGNIYLAMAYMGMDLNKQKVMIFITHMVFTSTTVLTPLASWVKM